MNKPMVARFVLDPFDHKDWIFEIKWDGFSTIAEVEGTRRSLCLGLSDVLEEKSSVTVLLAD